MEALLIFALIFGGFIAFRFMSHKKNLETHIRNEGGVDKVYEDFVSYFTEKGFDIRELTAHSVYLHYGNWTGKIGVEIIAVGKNKAEVSIGEEMATGQKHRAKGILRPDGDQRSVAEGILMQMPHRKEILSGDDEALEKR